MSTIKQETYSEEYYFKIILDTKIMHLQQCLILCIDYNELYVS